MESVSFTYSVLENLTRTSAITTSTKNDFTQELDWILPVVITILLLIVTFYIFLSLIHYGIKTKKWSKNLSSETDVLNAGLIYSSVIACAVFCIIRFCISLAFISIGFSDNSNNLCDKTGDALNTMYSFVIGSVALFLWFRQRAFYANRLLNVNYSRIMNFFSYFSIILIFVPGLCLTVFNSLPISYASSIVGCVTQPNSTLRTNFWIAVLVFILLFYSILLGLLIYALNHIRSSTNISQNNNLSNEENTVAATTVAENKSLCHSCYESFSKKHNKDKKKIILQRTLVFAVISILCDVFLQLSINFLFDPHGHRRVTTTLFNINSFINLTLVILSFSSYKSMVTLIFS